ncbi:MAG: flavin-dependent oxidoreductase [Paracoccaceae bacterium]|nr:flavin-dependent oxidoreductase [Paracoccaceae bacterium]
MSVLIAGAGIAGLTLGLSLHQAGVPFRIFEAVSELRPLGVGINLQPHAARELFELGLEAELDQVGLRTEEVAYFSAQGQLIWAEPRGMLAGYRWPQYSVHRGGLQMALRDALIARCGPDAIRTGAAVTGWQETSGGVRITLTNRKTGAALGHADGAVLIACDGINSTIRAQLHPDEGPAQWGGTMMWRGTTVGPRFRTGRTVSMTGTKQVKFVAYPIADIGEHSLINWIADIHMDDAYEWRQQDWNRQGRLEDFLPRFADWSFDWLDIPAVIRGAEAIYEYPMVDRDPLPRWTFGPVTLLGDAAHAMYPIGSNGASQGILDARVLARALRDKGPNANALEAYEEERRPPVNALVLANRGDGPDKILDIVASRAPDGFDDIDTVMSLEERETFAAGYKSIAGMDIEALNTRPSILGGA